MNPWMGQPSFGGLGPSMGYWGSGFGGPPFGFPPAPFPGPPPFGFPFPGPLPPSPFPAAQPLLQDPPPTPARRWLQPKAEPRTTLDRPRPRPAQPGKSILCLDMNDSGGEADTTSSSAAPDAGDQRSDPAKTPAKTSSASHPHPQVPGQTETPPASAQKQAQLLQRAEAAAESSPSLTANPFANASAASQYPGAEAQDADEAPPASPTAASGTRDNPACVDETEAEEEEEEEPTTAPRSPPAADPQPSAPGPSDEASEEEEPSVRPHGSLNIKGISPIPGSASLMESTRVGAELETERRPEWECLLCLDLANAAPSYSDEDAMRRHAAVHARHSDWALHQGINKCFPHLAAPSPPTSAPLHTQHKAMPPPPLLRPRAALSPKPFAVPSPGPKPFLTPTPLVRSAPSVAPRPASSSPKAPAAQLPHRAPHWNKGPYWTKKASPPPMPPSPLARTTAQPPARPSTQVSARPSAPPASQPPPPAPRPSAQPSGPPAVATVAPLKNADFDKFNTFLSKALKCYAGMGGPLVDCQFPGCGGKLARQKAPLSAHVRGHVTDRSNGKQHVKALTKACRTLLAKYIQPRAL